MAISLISGMEELEIDRIAKRFGVDFERRSPPTDADVAELVAQRLTALLEARLRARDKLQAERSERFIPLARDLQQDEDGLALIAMLLDDTYQQSLHAPLVPPEEDRPAPRRPASSSGEGRGGGRSGGSGGRRPGGRGRKR